MTTQLDVAQVLEDLLGSGVVVRDRVDHDRGGEDEEGEDVAPPGGDQMSFFQTAVIFSLPIIWPGE